MSVLLSTCLKYEKRGHFAKSYRRQISASVVNAERDPISSCLIVATIGFNKCVILIKVNGISVKILIDTGSTASFIDKKVLQRPLHHVLGNITYQWLLRCPNL